MQYILQYDYPLWCILARTNFHGHWIFLGVQLFLDIPGRTIIPGSGEKKKKVIEFWLCGFIFYNFDAVYGINGAQ